MKNTSSNNGNQAMNNNNNDDINKSNQNQQQNKKGSGGYTNTKPASESVRPSSGRSLENEGTNVSYEDQSRS